MQKPIAALIFALAALLRSYLHWPHCCITFPALKMLPFQSGNGMVYWFREAKTSTVFFSCAGMSIFCGQRVLHRPQATQFEARSASGMAS